MKLKIIAAAALIGGAALAAEAPAAFRAELSSTPFTLATRASVMGKGLATATLTGRTLKVDGRYAGLASDATKAHLKAASAMGVPGETFAELKVTGGTDGAVTGEARLTPAQLTSLKGGGVSIVIDSVKAPDGNVWGWLAPQ